MSDPWHTLIERIHASPQQAVIAVTGGGASAISELLSIPGGSRTLLEAVVPYSEVALTSWLGKFPEHFCIEETALAMAAVAYRRATQLCSPREKDLPETLAVSPRPLAGLSCTASLASDRPKKGDHRAFVATQTQTDTRSWSMLLNKGARGRKEEDQLVGRLILYGLARAAGFDDLPVLELRSDETLVEHYATADPLLIELLAGERKVAWSLPGQNRIHSEENRELTPPPRPKKSEILPALSPDLATFALPMGLLCGSFHPLHFGHEQLRAAAERQLGGPVYFEMSIRNVDKPPLDFLSIERRRSQFTSLPLALTAAPTFAEKAAALPGTVFVTGVDTAERIVEARYYQGSDAAMRAALSQIRDAGCRFLVAGRKLGERFETLADVAVPAEFAELFASISPDDFRADVSSTELRRAESH